jgi:biuret amidohydrolase
MPRLIRIIMTAAVLAGLSTPAADAQLPESTVEIDRTTTALVITDPQNDFLHPSGVAWGAVGESVERNGTVGNLESLMRSAKTADMPLFVSPHYYYPHDHEWGFGGPLEKMMHNIEMFDRTGPLRVDGFRGSGADWLEQYRPHIEDGQTVVTSPHKVYGPQTNDLALQLRKRGIQRVILAGMSANLCVEAHMRDLLQQGFEVAVVSDATAAAILPGLDGYQAALTNFRMMANDVITTEEAVRRIRGAPLRASR